MTIEDTDETALIEKKIFSRPWSKRSFEESLKNPCTIFMVYEYDGSIVGYCGIYLTDDCGDIAKVAVDEKYRKKGVAKEMLSNLLKAAKQNGVSKVSLDVRVSNYPAINLYSRFGFVKKGTRVGFYDMPVEDALIMWKEDL